MELSSRAYRELAPKQRAQIWIGGPGDATRAAVRDRRRAYRGVELVSRRHVPDSERAMVHFGVSTSGHRRAGYAGRAQCRWGRRPGRCRTCPQRVRCWTGCRTWSRPVPGAECLPLTGSVTAAAGPPKHPCGQAAIGAPSLLNPCRARASEVSRCHPGLSGPTADSI